MDQQLRSGLVIQKKITKNLVQNLISKIKTYDLLKYIVLTTSLLNISSLAHCTETGVSAGSGSYRLTGQGYFEIPPPGVYLLNHTGNYQSSKFVGNEGQKTLENAKIDLTFNAFRIAWVGDTGLWGSDWQFFEIYPTIIHSKFSQGSYSESETGLADFNFNPLGLAWKVKHGNIGLTNAIILPTGSYSQTDAVNLGNNYVTWNPQIYYQHYLPDGWGELSFHGGYEYSWANKDGLINQLNPKGAKYQSGQQIHGEIAVSKYIGNFRIAGNVSTDYQITRDKISGDTGANQILQNVLDGNKSKKVSAGLSAYYLLDGKIPLILNYSRDVYARNTSEGSTLVLTAAIPLKIFD